MNTSNVTGKFPGPKQLRCGWSKEPSVNLSLPFLENLEQTSYPVLLTMATIGGLLNLLVFSREKPKNAKSVYLIGMSCTDVLYMWSSLFIYVKLAMDKTHPTLSATEKQFFTNITGLCLFLQECSAFASDWYMLRLMAAIVMAFTTDRFLAIKSPLHHILVNAPRRAALIVGGIITLSVVVALNRLVDYYWFIANDRGFGALPKRPESLVEWKKFYGWALVVIPMTTFFVVIVLNAYLSRLLFRKRAHRHEVLQASDSWNVRSKPKHTSEKHASVMLGACVLLYLVTQTPALIMSIVGVLDNLCVSRQSKVFSIYMDPIRFTFLNINYSANFLLYCALSATFRAQVKKAFRKSVIYRKLSPERLPHRGSSPPSVKQWVARLGGNNSKFERSSQEMKLVR